MQPEQFRVSGSVSSWWEAQLRVFVYDSRLHVYVSAFRTPLSTLLRTMRLHLTLAHS